jgi:hypothetical protein
MLNIYDLLSEIAAEGEPEAGATPQETSTQAPDTVQETAPLSEIDLDGEKVTLDQIKEYRKGYLRQSDYTRKTQEVAAQRKELQQAKEVYEFIRSNPDLLKMMQEYNPENTTIQKPVVQQLNNDYDIRLKAMEIDHQLDILKRDDPDLNEVELLNYANDKGLDLETAYHAYKGKNFDNILKKKIAEMSSKMTEELKTNASKTKTLIKDNDSTNDNNYGLTKEELDVCAKIGMTPSDYAKYKR